MLEQVKRHPRPVGGRHHRDRAPPRHPQPRRRDAVTSTLRPAVDALHAYRESEAREEGMTKPQDELVCVGGPCEGERLKIPVGAKRIAAPLEQDGVRWFESGVYERTRGDQVDCLVWHRERSR